MNFVQTFACFVKLHLGFLFQDQLPLTTYKATIEGDRWMGEAIIPRAYFPPGVTKFNAYAIHGEDDNRIYEALYPAEKSQEFPDL